MADLYFPSQSSLEYLKVRPGQVLLRGALIGVAYTNPHKKVLATNLVLGHVDTDSKVCDRFTTRLNRALSNPNNVLDDPMSRDVKVIPYLGFDGHDVDHLELLVAHINFLGAFNTTKTHGTFHPDYEFVVAGTLNEVKPHKWSVESPTCWKPTPAKIDETTDESEFSAHLQKHLVDDSKDLPCLSIDLFNPQN